ncbi:MAG: four helix bundle protein [Deltaproteobacteria bacterium RIFOXYD12_FULL_57_12]|nr:MAG: four helix bundle protein [Deltaproteobacteria bacterium RIFOXYD12_FULL_57_12]
MKTYRDLLVWQKAMNLVTQIYQVSRLFPSDEIYGLTSQLRRCAVSIPSNIAEGQGRNSSGEFLRFLGIAQGSLCELQTQIEIACNLGYIEKETFDNLYDASREIERMQSSLMKRGCKIICVNGHSGVRQAPTL